jgi:extradiol dioxygenase family protein
VGGKPIPKPSILDDCEVVGIEAGRKVYKDVDYDLYYMWDSLHGEVEVFDKRGRHIGAACPQTGILIKPGIKSRRISKQN